MTTKQSTISFNGIHPVSTGSQNSARAKKRKINSPNNKPSYTYGGDTTAEKGKGSLSKGMSMLDTLSDQLGIENEVIESKSAINQKPVSREFNPEIDKFQMTTIHLKLLCQIAGIISDGNILSDLIFRPDGIYIKTLYCGLTVCVTIHIGSDMFTDIKCDEKEFIMKMNLVVLAKKLSIIKKLKCDVVTFEAKNENVILTGRSDNLPPAVISLFSFSSDKDDLDMSAFQYQVQIRFSSAKFETVLNGMPAVFTIKIDAKLRSLIFVGSEEHSKTKLQLPLDDDIIQEIKKFPQIAQYKASFVKSNLSVIHKCTKLAEHVLICFATKDSPLCARFLLDDLVDPAKSTSVTLYFAPKISDTEEE